jgi:hypothetical protein
MGPDSPLLPAPEIVGEPEGRYGADCRVALDAHHPPHERKSQTAVVDRQGTDGKQRVEKLATAMREARWVAPCFAMPEVDVDLLDSQACAHRVDGHPHLAPEAGREWEGGRARICAQPTLAGEGLSGDEACAQADQLPRETLGDSEASSASPRERRDDEVGAVTSERREGAAEIGIAEEQRARRRRPFPHGQCLAFPSAPEADDNRARPLRALCSPVRRVPVDDDDPGLREVTP